MHTDWQAQLPGGLADAREEAVVGQLAHHDAGHAGKAVHAVRAAGEHTSIFHAVGGCVSGHGSLKQALYLRRGTWRGNAGSRPHATRNGAMWSLHTGF